MADLRIVDAPLLSTVKGTEKIPTGGEGNFSVSVNQVADFAKLKWFLATEGYVDNAVGNVQADLNLHKNSVSNPHQVTKTQVGLANVDNTADLDKPVSNATQSAIITANSGKADKSYVDSQDQLKADKTTVEESLSLKAEKVDLVASKITTASDQTQQAINDFGGAKWYAKSGGYELGATVKLENGDTVQSTAPANTVNPNVDMTGWDTDNKASKIIDAQLISNTQTKDSFKNAYSSKRVNQFKVLRDQCAVGRAYIWKNPTQTGAADYRFSLGINMNGYKTAEWDFVADVDDFYRMKYGFTNSIRPPTLSAQAVELSATPFGTTSNNQYFRSNDQIGANFKINFTGIGFLMNHRCDEYGGLWSISIDGAAAIIISTHINNPENSTSAGGNISKLVTNVLSNTSHTAVFTFIGDDPNYPPTGGVSRGWFKKKSGTGVEVDAAYVISGSEMGRAPTGSTLVANAILEFAISAKPSGSALVEDWIPAHGSASGCIVVNSRKIFINENQVDNLLSNVSSEVELKEFTMIQNYTAYNSADTLKSQPLWTGNLITKFDRLEGLVYDHTFVTNNIFVIDGYTAMCSGQRKDSSGNTIFTKIQHDNGFTIDISAAPPLSQINHDTGVLTSCRWIGDKFGLAVKVDSAESSSALGRNTTDSNATLTTERPDRFCKLYFKPMGKNKEIEAGEEFTSRHSLWLAIL